MKSSFFLAGIMALALTGMTAASCSNDDDITENPLPEKPKPAEPETPTELVLTGDTATGVWAKNTTVKVAGHHVVVPE